MYNDEGIHSDRIDHLLNGGTRNEFTEKRKQLLDGGLVEDNKRVLRSIGMQ